MFNKTEFKKLCIEAEHIDVEAYWEYRRIWKLLIDLICKDDESFSEFILYMKNEMASHEYSTLSEISDEIVDAFPSMEFIEAYKTLAKKYPEETEKYHIADFIRDAEKSVKYSLTKGDYL